MDKETLLYQPGEQNSPQCTKHAPDARYGSRRIFWKHIANGGKYVGAPCLVSRGCDTNYNDGKPHAGITKNLRKNDRGYHNRIDKH